MNDIIIDLSSQKFGSYTGTCFFCSHIWVEMLSCGFYPLTSLVLSITFFMLLMSSVERSIHFVSLIYLHVCFFQLVCDLLEGRHCISLIVHLKFQCLTQSEWTNLRWITHLPKPRPSWNNLCMTSWVMLRYFYLFEILNRRYTIVVESMEFGARLPKFKYYFNHFLIVWTFGKLPKLFVPQFFHI